MSALVTVIMPCHNAAPWVEQAVDSVLGQSWDNLELIVVDDGSSDDSASVLARFVQPVGVEDFGDEGPIFSQCRGRSLLVLKQGQTGKAKACNRALQYAKGEYIKYLDADDLLSPDMIERQVRILEGRAAEAGPAVAYGEWARFYERPQEADFVERAGWHDGVPAAWLTEVLRDGQPMLQCGQFLVPRALLNKVGGWSETLTLIDDFEFFTRLICASEQVLFTPGARLYYRSGLSGSLSRRKTAAAWDSATRSALLGTGYLVALDGSAAARRSAANFLQELVYSMYPFTGYNIAALETRIRELGGSCLGAQGGRVFLLLARVFGWKFARRLQCLAGKAHR